MAKAPKSETEKSIASMDKIRFADGPTPVAELRLKLQKQMQDHAAVYRTQASLEEGVVRDETNLVSFLAVISDMVALVYRRSRERAGEGCACKLICMHGGTIPRKRSIRSHFMVPFLFGTTLPRSIFSPAISLPIPEF